MNSWDNDFGQSSLGLVTGLVQGGWLSSSSSSPPPPLRVHWSFSRKHPRCYQAANPWAPKLRSVGVVPSELKLNARPVGPPCALCFAPCTAKQWLQSESSPPTQPPSCPAVKQLRSTARSSPPQSSTFRPFLAFDPQSAQGRTLVFYQAKAPSLACYRGGGTFYQALPSLGKLPRRDVLPGRTVRETLTPQEFKVRGGSVAVAVTLSEGCFVKQQ